MVDFIQGQNENLAFKLIPVTVSEVFVKLKKLKRKKAAGPDNLLPGFLNDVAIIIAKPLAHTSSIFPSQQGLYRLALKLDL